MIDFNKTADKKWWLINNVDGPKSKATIWYVKRGTKIMGWNSFNVFDRNIEQKQT